MGNDEKRNSMMIIPLVFVLLAIVGNVIAFAQLGKEVFDATVFINTIAASFSVVALLCAIIYVVTGFKKDSAKYFKFFLYTFVLVVLCNSLGVIVFNLNFATSGQKTLRTITILINIAVFIILNILLLKNDLGKKVSFILSIVLLIVYAPTHIFNFVSGMITKQYFSGFRSFANLALTLVLVLMEQLKYFDKTQRNTK